jgi:hypothetical protein
VILGSFSTKNAKCVYFRRHVSLTLSLSAYNNATEAEQLSDWVRNLQVVLVTMVAQVAREIPSQPRSNVGNPP